VCKAIGTHPTAGDITQEFATSVANNTDYHPNQKVLIGGDLPLITYAASWSVKDRSDTLPSDNNIVVLVETTPGDTPRLAAARDSLECLKLLIADQCLNSNEHGNHGEGGLCSQ
jgi:hypothetical protein